MGKKKVVNLPEDTATEAQAQASPEPARPPAGDYCRIVNLTRQALQCPLTTGRTVPLGPNVPGRQLHISAPILKKHKTGALFAWERKHIIRFAPVEEGEL